MRVLEIAYILQGGMYAPPEVLLSRLSRFAPMNAKTTYNIGTPGTEDHKLDGLKPGETAGMDTVRAYAVRTRTSRPEMSH